MLPRLDARGVAKHYAQLVALREATFHVHAGEVLGLLGPNGAGKTTLMACLAGLVVPDAGDLRVHGAPLTESVRRNTVFYLPDGITPWSAQSARWLLEFAANTFGVATPSRGDTSVDDIRRVLRIGELGTQRIGTLSKGQRKRLLLALALQMPHPVLLLDEPFDGLDIRLTRDVIALLKSIARDGRSIVVSLHDMHDAARVCDRLVLLDDGRTVAEGTLAELRERSGLADADLEEVFLAFV